MSFYNALAGAGRFIKASYSVFDKQDNLYADGIGVGYKIPGAPKVTRYFLQSPIRLAVVVMVAPSRVLNGPEALL